MKLVDHPPKMCYNQNRRMKLPKRSLALLLVLALLLGTSGSFSAQENDPPIVIEFDPIENAEFFEMIEPGSADAADLLGVDLAEDAFAVDFAAAIDLDWETNGGVVDLGDYDIQYGDYHLLYVTIVPIGAFDTPFSFNMIAGQSISVSIVPWLHTNPDAPMWESGFVHDWNLIPWFEGIQYASNDESILQVQFYQADIAAGKQNPTSVWLSSTREGTAMVQLVLPDEIIIQQNVVVLPRPASFPRPEDYLATPHAPRVTAGQSVVTAIANEPEDSGLLAPQVIDWASSDPSVAVIDGAVVFDDLGEPVFGTEKNGKRELSIKGLKAGKAVITIFVSTTSTGGVLRTVGYYWLDVTVEAAGGFQPITPTGGFLDFLEWIAETVVSFFSMIGSLFSDCGGSGTMNYRLLTSTAALSSARSTMNTVESIFKDEFNITLNREVDQAKTSLNQRPNCTRTDYCTIAACGANCRNSHHRSGEHFFRVEYQSGSNTFNFVNFRFCLDGGSHTVDCPGIAGGAGQGWGDLIVYPTEYVLRTTVHEISHLLGAPDNNCTAGQENRCVMNDGTPATVYDVWCDSCASKIKAVRNNNL